MNTLLDSLQWSLPFFLAFLVGSLPTSYLLVKWKTGQDIRKLGSGNAGATNVFRTVGRAEGCTVLFIDFCKSLGAVLILSYSLTFPFTSFVTYQFLIGLCAILGHVFTPFLRFKGGKGVASAAGVALAIYPFNFFIALATWSLMLLWLRYMSVASISGAAAFAITGIFTMENRLHLILAIICAIFIAWTHRSNIRRLLKREETKFQIKRHNR